MHFKVPDKLEPDDEVVPERHSLVTIAKLVAWVKAPFLALGRKINGGNGNDDRVNEQADD